MDSQVQQQQLLQQGAGRLSFPLTDLCRSMPACMWDGWNTTLWGDGWNTTLWGQATYSVHGATVPLYDTLGPDTVSYVINQTELTTVVVGAKVRGASVVHMAPAGDEADSDPYDLNLADHHACLLCAFSQEMLLHTHTGSHHMTRI